MSERTIPLSHKPDMKSQSDLDQFSDRLPHVASPMSPVLILAAIGLALFLSAMWTARADASGVSTPVVYTTRFVSLATCLFLAWTFRNHVPPVSLLLGIAASLMGAHLINTLVAPTIEMSPETALVLDYVSGIFEGVANSLITLLFAHIFSSFQPRRSVFAIALAYLLVDIGILFLDTLSTDAMHYMRPIFSLAGTLVLLLCGR